MTLYTHASCLRDVLFKHGFPCVFTFHSAYVLTKQEEFLQQSNLTRISRLAGGSIKIQVSSSETN